MTCDACAQAQSDPLTPHYSANCLNCAARAMAHGPIEISVENDQWFQSYMAGLLLVAGGDAAELHGRIKDWHRRVQEDRK